MDEERRVGRAEALAVLVAERQGQMVGYARKRLRCSGVPPSSAEARDVVQNALTSVLACPEPVEQLRPYVFAAIRNEVRHAVRRHRTGRGYASLDADVRLESGTCAADPCAAADLRLDLDAAIDALPPQQRTAVLLHKKLGLTQAQTAKAMGAAPGTVATHVARALVTLRITLGVLAVAAACGAAALGMRSGLLPVGPAAGGKALERLLYSPTGAVAGAAVGAALGWMLWKPLLLRPARWAASQIRSRRRAEESSVDWQGESWTVRRVAGPSAGDRMYRCPGCDQVIASGVAHVVAWPAHGGVEDRRHWHTACWNARDRRSARVRRPRSAPEA